MIVPARPTRSARLSVPRRPAHPARRAALTLLELTIALALIALLVSMLLTFFWQTVRVRDAASLAVQRKRLMKQVLEGMAAELKSTVALEQIGSAGFQQFTGQRRSISFLTTPLPTSEAYTFYRVEDDGPILKHDLFQVTYELWIDPNEETDEGDPLVGGLLRIQRQAVDPSILPEEVPEDEPLFYQRYDLWAPEIGYLEFRYFDGVEWSTTWEVSEGNRLPHMVQITVGFDSLTREAYEDQDLNDWPIDQYPLGPPETNPNRFSLMVRLPAADEMFSARLNRLEDAAEEVYDWEGEPAAGDELEGGGK